MAQVEHGGGLHAGFVNLDDDEDLIPDERELWRDGGDRSDGGR